MHTLIYVTFSLPPGVGGWLRLLLVALPGLFCLPFSNVATRGDMGWVSCNVKQKLETVRLWCSKYRKIDCHQKFIIGL